MCCCRAGQTEHWGRGLGLAGRAGYHFLAANWTFPLLLGKTRLCKACSLKNRSVQVPQLSSCWNIQYLSKSCQFSLAWHAAAASLFSSNMCLWRLPPPRYIPAHVIHGNTEITGLLLAPGSDLGCQLGRPTGKYQWE